MVRRRGNAAAEGVIAHLEAAEAEYAAMWGDLGYQPVDYSKEQTVHVWQLPDDSARGRRPGDRVRVWPDGGLSSLKSEPPALRAG